MGNAGGECRERVLDPITNCGNWLNIQTFQKVLPDYTIKQFTEQIYSVCKFKRHDSNFNYIASKEEIIENDNKLDNSFSRARSMIKQYGLCNDWDYFMTLTLDKTKYNRFNLSVFRMDLMQWIRDIRKRYKKLYGDEYKDRLSVLIVPENHKDGAWHMHGLVKGIPENEVTDFIKGIHPKKLIDKGFKNWSDYSNKFGFCSLGKIRDHYSSVLYICKYIDKNIAALAEMKGEHLYFHSRPLNTAITSAHVYGHNSELDNCIEWEGKFCSIGMAINKDWTFAGRYDDAMEKLKINEYTEVIPLKENKDFDPSFIDSLYEYDLSDYQTIW